MTSKFALFSRGESVNFPIFRRGGLAEQFPSVTSGGNLVGRLAALACLFALNFPALVLAATVTLSPVDIASGRDNGPKDGTFDSFVNPGVPSLVDNGFTDFRIAAEFDLTSITEPIVAATLGFVAQSSNTPAQIEIHGYNANGIVEVLDTGFVGNLLGAVPGSLGNNSLDVTGFIATGLIGNFAGFSFDEALRQPPPSPLTNFFSTFRLTMETDTSVVPVPAAIWLFGSGLVGLMAFSRRKTARHNTFMLNSPRLVGATPSAF